MLQTMRRMRQTVKTACSNFEFNLSRRLQNARASSAESDQTVWSDGCAMLKAQPQHSQTSASRLCRDFLQQQSMLCSSSMDWLPVAPLLTAGYVFLITLASTHE